jgi:metallo-beta-lactamase family protein
LYQLKQSGTIPNLPILVDSPMAASATDAFLAHPNAVRLSAEQLRAMTRDVAFTQSVDESRAINRREGPFILLAASGMLTGGRVLHHILNRANNPKNLIIFVGFQAPGTRGAKMIAGERVARIYGQDVEIACEVEEIKGFSAHADRSQLVDWLASAPSRPARVFLNHGEPLAADALRLRLVGLGYDAVVADERRAWTLSPGPPAPALTSAEAGLLRFATALSFRDDDNDTLDAVCAAVDRVRRGLVPSLPLVVHGASLGAKVRAALPQDAWRYVTFDLS